MSGLMQGMQDATCVMQALARVRRQLRTLQMVLRVAALCNTPSQKTAVETAAAQYSCVLCE